LQHNRASTQARAQSHKRASTTIAQAHNRACAQSHNRTPNEDTSTSNGHNEITLQIQPIAESPKGEKASLQIRVYLLSNDPEKPGKEVLRWQAPDSGAPAKITLPIEISR
jgi:hypothetical protein